MSDAENPTLFGTQKDYAWDAWQKAFDGGTLLLPDHEKFLAWWEEASKRSWPSTRELMADAWSKGSEDRRNQSNAGFWPWWQEILDTQPKTTP